MRFSSIYRSILVLLCFSAFSIGFATNEQLTRTDVHRIMNEMLSQHVDKKELDGEVLKKSFEYYMDQFDPTRTYLLESEVNQFQQLSPNQLDQALAQYKIKNFARFEELNGVIQNSINRARKIRQDQYAKIDYLFQKSSGDSAQTELGEDRKIPYPSNLEQLQMKIEDEAAQFIGMERKRYGDRGVLENKKDILDTYERAVRHRENQYLFLNDQDQPLLPREKENLFVMHVLKALARSLDSHSSFLNADETFDMKVRLEKGFQGIGVVLQKKPQGIVVARTIKDSPAEKSGKVKVDDEIIEVNGANVKGYSLQELVGRLRDDSKPETTLVLKRLSSGGGAETIQVSLKRELIAVDEGRVDILTEPFQDGIVGVLRLGTFYQGGNGITSEKDMREAIHALNKQGNLKGLILDLRENSGGFLNQAVKVAGLFITNGVVVVSKYSNGEERFYRDMDGKVSFDGPIIVLTSKATASAAEIVAQALQDYGVAIVVGDEQTYGKGTIQSQTVTDNEDVPHFKVTVGKYYTVSGKTPQKKGVKADIVVPSHYDKEILGEEYLDGALSSDTVSPAYQDELTDVEKGLKPWYIRYYMPTLQKEKKEWKSFLPALREESQKRMAGNQEYKKFLANSRQVEAANEQDPKKIILDPQVIEAVNILKDMIILDKKQRQEGLADIKSN